MERRVRLVTGLALFAYAICHFISHATGLFGVATMDAVGRQIILAPWHTAAGRSALLVSVLIHGGLGLQALYRRRHLRIPAAEAWQLALGLSIPLLLIPHATNVGAGVYLFGLDDSYFRILYQYWITPPWTGLLRQLVLLAVVWLHGCIGIHAWLRRYAWYQRERLVLLACAVLLPFLAVLGLVNAGWGMAMRATLHPEFAAAHGPPMPGTIAAYGLRMIRQIWQDLQLLYLGILLAILSVRLARNLRARRHPTPTITYSNGRSVRVPRGFSVLEASRWARIPHASICGGRGRCSTCRIRVTDGHETLPHPSAAETATLQRVNARPPVRLACQVRPTRDIRVTPLLPADVPPGGLRIAVEGGREMCVTALFIDLRDSTRLAAGRLPFDALFIIDRYIQRVTAAIEAHGGHVTSVAGDGIMSVFGVETDAAAGAARALAAAAEMWESLDRLSVELRAELEKPLAFGIGLHSGEAAVGSIRVGGRMSLHFLGDTGNVAARLEGLTKEMRCTVIVSEAVLATAGLALPSGLELTELRIRGREESPVRAALLRCRPDAQRLTSGDKVSERA